MQRTFEGELKGIKGKVLEMAGLVEAALEIVTSSLAAMKSDRIKEVAPIEERINSLHLEIDNLCFMQIIRQAPVASDLRFLFAMTKMITDLERMGDQTVNISHLVKDFLAQPRRAPTFDIPQLSEEVKWMVRKALASLVNFDAQTANEVLAHDDVVDRLKDETFKKSLVLMKDDSANVEAGTYLILIARNLERLGDHCTNIAEEVIFVCSGDDVRHPKVSRIG